MPRSLVGDAALKYLRSQGVVVYVLRGRLRAYAPRRELLRPALIEMIRRWRVEIVNALDAMVE